MFNISVCFQCVSIISACLSLLSSCRFYRIYKFVSLCVLMLIRCCHGTSIQNSDIRIFLLVLLYPRVSLEGCETKVEVGDGNKNE